MRSQTSFSMSILFISITQISQLINPVNFSRLAWPLPPRLLLSILAFFSLQWLYDGYQSYNLLNYNGYLATKHLSLN